MLSHISFYVLYGSPSIHTLCMFLIRGVEGRTDDHNAAYKDANATEPTVFDDEEVKYPIIEWEIHTEGSRTYWKIIKVGGIKEAYQSFKDMLKGFNREDMKLQRYMHYPSTWKIHSNYGVHQVSSTTRRHDMFMLTEKDYPLSNGVMTVMLSTKLQVEEDSEMDRDLLMKIFMEANKPKSGSLDTSSK
nr:hypothetical protein [Tanacetum cinerariifolium]